jgi:hypothetical protein
MSWHCIHAELTAKPAYGHSVLKLKLDKAAGRLDLVDWFTPQDIRKSNHEGRRFGAAITIPGGAIISVISRSSALL